MSKRVLSLIKPRQNAKPTSLQTPSYEPDLRKQAYSVSKILHTHQNWDQFLQAELARESIDASEIAPLVFDRIRDLELGIRFFDWVIGNKYWSSLDSYGYSSFLKLLARNKAFSEAEDVLNSLKLQGFLPTREAVDVLIQSYSVSGLVDRALEKYKLVISIYNCLPNVFACNALLDVLVKWQRIGVALEIYDEMLNRDDAVDNYSTCIIVRGLCREGKVDKGRKLIEDRWGRGCVPNIVFYNTLIDGYCRIGQIVSALEIFRLLKLRGFLPTEETYGALINGYCKIGDFVAVDNLLVEMKARGLSVNVNIYNNMIDSRFNHGLVVDPLAILKDMSEIGCDPDIITFNTFIKGLCSLGKIEEADKLLCLAAKRGFSPDMYSYTPLIHFYCKRGDIERASQLLVEVTERCHKADLVTYGALVHGLVVTGEVKSALDIHKKMVERGMALDAEIYNTLISGLCKKGMVVAAKELIAEMLHQNLLPDAFVFTSLINGFIVNGKIDEATRLFEVMVAKGLDPGVVGYNAMIKGYCKFGKMIDAVSCMKRMINGKRSPDEFTYSTMIDGYVKQHDMDNALKTFNEMVKWKCKPNVVTYTTLINGHCRLGDLSAAELVFREMKSSGLEPNVVSYSILIGGFCKGNELAKAALLFEEMLKKKCTPNECTFNYLVNGFVNNANDYIDSEEHSKILVFCIFRTMISDGWSPRTAIYNCILLCLCRYKMLPTALRLNEKMTSKGCRLNPVTFVAILLGVCMEGRSSEWRNVISWNLNEHEISVAVKYLTALKQYFSLEISDKAILIVQTELGAAKSEIQKWHSPSQNESFIPTENSTVVVVYTYINEDVSLGSRFIGLDVDHVDDRRLCCGTPPDCEWKAQAGNLCVASFDWSCSGVCKSVERMSEVHRRCGEGDNVLWNTVF